MRTLPAWTLLAALALSAVPALAQAEQPDADCNPCDSHAGATYEDGTPCADCLEPRPATAGGDNGADDTVADCGADGCAYPTMGEDQPTHGGCDGEVCAYGDGPADSGPVDDGPSYGDCGGEVCAYDESHGGLPPAGADQGDAAYRGATLALLGASGLAVLGLVALRRRA